MNDSQLIERFGWGSKVEVGGWVNLEDLTHAHPLYLLFQEEILNARSAWPDEWDTMPVEEREIRQFRKAADRVAKALKTQGQSPAIPFARVAYGEGGDFMRSQGYVQYHSTIVLANVKLAVHWWGGHDPHFGFRQEDGSIDCRVPKVKIENQGQLDLVLSHL